MAPVGDVVRRELRRLSPDVKIQSEQIQQVLVNEVLKREVVKGDKAEEAKKKLARSANKMLRNRADKEVVSTPASTPMGVIPPLTEAPHTTLPSPSV